MVFASFCRYRFFPRLERFIVRFYDLICYHLLFSDVLCNVCAFYGCGWCYCALYRFFLCPTFSWHWLRIGCYSNKLKIDTLESRSQQILRYVQCKRGVDDLFTSANENPFFLHSWYSSAVEYHLILLYARNVMCGPLQWFKSEINKFQINAMHIRRCVQSVYNIFSYENDYLLAIHVIVNTLLIALFSMYSILSHRVRWANDELCVRVWFHTHTFPCCAKNDLWECWVSLK